MFGVVWDGPKAHCVASPENADTRLIITLEPQRSVQLAYRHAHIRARSEVHDQIVDLDMNYGGDQASDTTPPAVWYGGTATISDD